jgi:hypothetical protein
MLGAMQFIFLAHDNLFIDDHFLCDYADSLRFNQPMKAPWVISGRLDTKSPLRSISAKRKERDK